MSADDSLHEVLQQMWRDVEQDRMSRQGTKGIAGHQHGLKPIPEEPRCVSCNETTRRWRTWDTVWDRWTPDSPLPADWQQVGRFFYCADCHQTYLEEERQRELDEARVRKQADAAARKARRKSGSNPLYSPR